jgi:hypothetical protein
MHTISKSNAQTSNEWRPVKVYVSHFHSAVMSILCPARYPQRPVHTTDSKDAHSGGLGSLFGIERTISGIRMIEV